VKLRVAAEADVETLFDIRTSVSENHESREELAAIGVTPETVARMLRTTARAWLAEVGGSPVAFAMADAGQGTIFAMFVRPGYEGRGLGRALMGEAESWLFAEGWEEIWLLTGGDERLRANGFYRRLGWSAAGAADDGQLKFIKRR
jgi:GNAT superfamily N-acetyltransferase